MADQILSYLPWIVAAALCAMVAVAMWSWRSAWREAEMYLCPVEGESDD